MTPRRSEHGFTLIELMVSLVVFSFVVVGILAVAVSMTNGYREQRDAVNAEGLVRVPIDYIVDALRQASPAVSSFNIQDANTCSLSALTVTNSSTGPDSIDVIFASGGVVTTVKNPFISGNTVDVVDATGIAANDYVVISNLGQGHFYKVTGVAANTLTVQTNCGTYALPAGGYLAGSMVIRAQHATFTVAALDTGTALWMDPDAGGPLANEPLAENIEDMQVVVGIDTAADGLGTEIGSAVDDDEYSFNKAGDAAIAVWPPATGTIRAIRLTLIARAPMPDSGNALAYTRPAAGDRAASGADNFRRRTLRSTIEFRNVGVSP